MLAEEFRKSIIEIIKEELFNRDRLRSRIINQRLEWMFRILGISSMEELSDSSLERLLQDFQQN